MLELVFDDDPTIKVIFADSVETAKEMLTGNSDICAVLFTDVPDVSEACIAAKEFAKQFSVYTFTMSGDKETDKSLLSAGCSEFYPAMLSC